MKLPPGSTLVSGTPPAPSNDSDLTRTMGNGMPTQDDMSPADEQHPIISSGLKHAGNIVRGMFNTVAQPPEGAIENIASTAGPLGLAATRMVRGQFQAEKQLAPQLSTQVKAAQASHAAQPPVTAQDLFSNPVSAANNAGPTLEDLRAANTALAMVNPLASASVANVNQLHDEGKPQQAAGEGIVDALALGSSLPGPARAMGGVLSDSAKGLRGVAADTSTGLPPQRGVVSKLMQTGKIISEPIPIVGKLVDEIQRVQKFKDVPGKLRDTWQGDAQQRLFNNTPKLGDSPLFNTADQPFLQSGNVRSTPMPEPAPFRGIASSEPAPAPYRLKGDQIVDATTATPKRVLGPERQLNAAPEDVSAQPARGVTQGKAPYVPGAQMEPAPFLTMHGAETGETAALMQLSHTGRGVLTKIAAARGLKVPAAADSATLIQKIHADMSPQEIQSFADAAKARAADRAASLEGVDPAIVADNKAIAQKLYSKADEMQAAGESPYKIRAWRTAGESIETRPTPVKDILGDTDALRTIRGVDKKMAQHIQDVTAPEPQSPAPQRGFSQQQPPPAPEAPKPQIATEANTENLLRQSLAQRGVTQPKAQAAAAGVGKSPPGQAPVSSTPPAGGFSSARQGGHAGNTVSSVEELSRPGTNYVVSKSGQLTYHGKSFAPESIPNGATHVTALPDGTLRVNAGPQLSEAQEIALRRALPRPSPRGVTQQVTTKQK